MEIDLVLLELNEVEGDLWKIFREYFSYDVNKQIDEKSYNYIQYRI